MSSLGAPELVIILIIVLLVFGSSKLPKLARSLGEAKNEFEKTASSSSTPDATAAAAAPAVPAAPAEPVITMTKAEYDALLAQRDTATKD